MLCLQYSEGFTNIGKYGILYRSNTQVVLLSKPPILFKEVNGPMQEFSVLGVIPQFAQKQYDIWHNERAYDTDKDEQSAEKEAIKA